MNRTTTYRFGPCELDQARRLLSAHGRELRLQPRVFDLLCYLVRHRERVVPKDELLEALWPGTIVVDNALQRVVSLARAALAEVGLDDVVRTYSRHGYRFCFEADGAASSGNAVAAADGTTAAASPAGAPTAAAATRPLSEAHAACERGDWAAASDAFALADGLSPLPPAEVEQWGRAAICAGLGPRVTAALERMVAECDASGDVLAAARATLLLAQIRIDHRQAPLARGLLQRASRFLDGRSAAVERGHYAWMSCRMALGEGDLARALALADEACHLGRTLRDAEVECLGLVYRGNVLLAQGDVTGGVAQHEEAAAVSRTGGIDGWVAGWTLCSLLYAARHRCDWVRATQFADAFVEWSRDSRMPAFPGTCQLHRAAVLAMHGEIDRATSEARAAAELLAHAAPWAEGDAHCVLGDIQMSCGDFEAAEASYRHAHALGWDPQPGLGRLYLHTGRAAEAVRDIERALDEGDWTQRQGRGQLLCLLVHAALATGDAERARAALCTLDADPQMLATEALKAMHGAAEAELALHEGDRKLAAQKLRQALRRWREAGCRLGEMETRARLAACLIEDGDATGAGMEVQAMRAQAGPAASAFRARIEALHERLGHARVVS